DDPVAGIGLKVQQRMGSRRTGRASGAGRPGRGALRRPGALRSGRLRAGGCCHDERVVAVSPDRQGGGRPGPNRARVAPGAARTGGRERRHPWACDPGHDAGAFCMVPTIAPDKLRPFRSRAGTSHSGKVEIVIALLCPGQGSQTPGMLEPWLELPGARDFLGDLGEAARIDLIGLGTTADAETIKDTAVAQPLIVGSSLLALHLLVGEVGPVAEWAGLVAGHSVGELPAVAAAGTPPPAVAVELVGVRGRAMAAAAGAADTGMAAVVGPDADAVTAAIEAAGLVAANVNGGGQVVAAGARADLEALAANPPERTRVIPLAVAGAFHTSYMAPAVEPVAAAAAALAPTDPTVPVLTNSSGEP